MKTDGQSPGAALAACQGPDGSGQDEGGHRPASSPGRAGWPAFGAKGVPLQPLEGGKRRLVGFVDRGFGCVRSGQNLAHHDLDLVGDLGIDRRTRTGLTDLQYFE